MSAIVFLVFFVCLVLAVPIAMCMGFATILPGLLDPKFAGNLEVVVRSMLKGVDTMSILAIPFVHAFRRHYGNRRTFETAV